MREATKHRNLTISGVGNAGGGVYHDVKIKGVGSIQGDIECAYFKVDGVANVYGQVKAQHLHIRGRSMVEGNVTSDEVNIEGEVSITGNCESETFRSHGAVTIGGLLNAGEVALRLHGTSKAGEIGGGVIRVKKAGRLSFFSRSCKLSVEAIEGDDVHLEYTRAKVVRGNNVYIGPGCSVDLVEYQNNFRQATGAKVLEQKKV